MKKLYIIFVCCVCFAFVTGVHLSKDYSIARLFVEDAVYIHSNGVISNTNAEGGYLTQAGTSIVILLVSDFVTTTTQSAREQLLYEPFGLSHDEIDIITREARLEAKSYYADLRKAFDDKYQLLMPDEIETASPYIEIFSKENIDGIDDLDDRLILALSDDMVEYVSITDVYVVVPFGPIECVFAYHSCGGGGSNYTPQPEDFVPGHDFATVLDTINIGDVHGMFDASNIKIGIWEAIESQSGSGRIPAHLEFSGRTRIRRYTNSTILPSLHATQVGIVAAGNSGIARNSIIYSTDFNPNAGLIDLPALQWFVDNQVSVVNASFGTNWSNNTSVINSRINAYDLFVRDNFLVLVVASGNHRDGTYVLGAPALANNVITVGATTISGDEITWYSVYERPQALPRFKPNLVAVGNMNIPNSGYNEGTSFAAPLVTGAIALAMQHSPVLRLFPEKIMSILSATSNNVIFYPGFETNHLNDMYGSGLLDIAKFIENVMANHTVLHTHSGNTNPILSHEVPVSASTQSPIYLSVALNWLTDVVEGNPVINNYDLKVYLNDLLLTNGTGSSTYGNSELVRLIIESSGTLRFEVRIIGGYSGLRPDLLAMTWHIDS
ncbi:MAG: hypothetical protein EA375_02150 [Acholeplasmataceae bacterium]|nr:MAG: hypothetical protein EA375_02150 [Acholeplasmataceae bacterium]